MVEVNRLILPEMLVEIEGARRSSRIVFAVKCSEFILLKVILGQLRPRGVERVPR
jgi:hypothetical protein